LDRLPSPDPLNFMPKIAAMATSRKQN